MEMETSTVRVFMSLVLGGLPLVALVLWWWNEIWYVIPVKFRIFGSGSKLPPGHMGFPFIGEMLTFLWYFKFLRRPDDYINHKRRKYGDGVGLYRTHLFGAPSIIACDPKVNKYILQSDEQFVVEWPNVDLVGFQSIVAVHGKAHARLRAFLVNAINHPDALRQVAIAVQPPLVSALESCVQLGHIKAYDLLNKVTFENIGKYFASLEAGPMTNTMSKLFKGLTKGIKAYRFNFPGTAYCHAIQCRKKLEGIFREELERRKRNESKRANDLMDGLMKMKDEQGNQLSDQEILDNIVSLVVAGYESTSIASMWAMYYLAKYPNVLQKLREENMALSQRKKGDMITYDDAIELKYTKNVVEETIRMANLSSFIFRRILKEVQCNGYTLPKNWKIILCLRYIHTNPENFDDPLCFNPDRWNERAKPGTYLVFGGGARICAGNMLARLQLTLLLHHLSVGYKWELLNPNADIIYLPHPTPADGVEISINKI